MAITDTQPTEAELIAELSQCVDVINKLIEQADLMNARSEKILEGSNLVLAEIRARLDDGALA